MCSTYYAVIRIILVFTWTSDDLWFHIPVSVEFTATVQGSVWLHNAKGIPVSAAVTVRVGENAMASLKGKTDLPIKQNNVWNQRTLQSVVLEQYQKLGFTLRLNYPLTLAAKQALSTLSCTTCGKQGTVCKCCFCSGDKHMRCIILTNTVFTLVLTSSMQLQAYQFHVSPYRIWISLYPVSL